MERMRMMNLFCVMFWVKTRCHAGVIHPPHHLSSDRASYYASPPCLQNTSLNTISSCLADLRVKRTTPWGGYPPNEEP
jgi:hypothetical protein